MHGYYEQYFDIFSILNIQTHETLFLNDICEC
jgi:hypothetical protein